MRTQRRLSVSDFRYTPLVAALGLALAPAPANAAAVTVTNPTDATSISIYNPPDVNLRGAIDHFNARDTELLTLLNCSGADVINFDFPNGPFLVSLSAELPAIECDGLTIDGSDLGTYLPFKDLHVPITPADPIGTQVGLATDSSASVAAKNLEIYGFSYGTGTGLLGRFASNNNYLHDNVIGFDNAGLVGTSIANSSVSSNATGIYISYGGTIATALMADVTNNTVNNNTLQGIYLDNARATVSTNTITNNGTGVSLVNASNNTLDTNRIFSNSSYGIEIVTGVNNAMVGNLVHGNAGSLPAAGQKNINLGFSGGPLPNDPGDVDSGIPNDGQNYPVIDSVVPDVANNRTIVSFTLDTQPGDYRVDLYSNASVTTVPGGDLIVATISPFSVAAGPTSGNFTVPGLTTDNFSMLATSLPASGVGETSEFSPVVGFVPAPNVGISPSSSIDFGDVATNTDSPATSVSIASTGTLPYHLYSLSDSACSGGAICASGAFTCTTTCTNNTDYAPGSACQVTATFHPTVLGPFSHTIQICDNVGPDSRTITLSGNGVVPPPIAISPPAWDFGSGLLGIHSPSTTFTIFNPGGVPVSIGVPTTSPDFVIESTDCGATIPAKDRCHANVSFAPSRPGAITGTLSVTAGTVPSAASSSKRARLAKAVSGPAATAALSGTGVIQAILELPSAIDFGDYTSGSAALRRTVTLRNNGNAVLTLSNVSVTGPFTLGNGCAENLQPNESCTLTLDFSSAALGPYSGTLVVVSNAVGGSRSIPLSARTVTVAAPRIRVSPASIGFGDRLLGTVSGAQRVTITNDGSDAAVLSAPVTTNLDFLVVGTTCGLSLAPAQTCFADVALRPVGFGPRAGQLLINSNAAGSPNRVDLLGTGCRPFSSTASRLGENFGCSP